MTKTPDETPSGAGAPPRPGASGDDASAVAAAQAGGVSLADIPEAERRNRVSRIWSESLAKGATIHSSLSDGPVPPPRRGRRRRVARDPEEPLDERIHDNFELLGLLGEGGMGAVYAARQKSVDRVIALKRLRNRTDSPEALRETFLKEAIVTGELEHPNIVPIYDVGESEAGEVFYAMRRVEGRGWDEEIGEIDLGRNLDILLRVADAVAFAHDRKIIHRDLKPENVMLGAFGEVVLMDWGLAASIDDAGRAQGLAATVAGTPTYMAPEMALALPDRIGPQSDIYLLGAILFEIVAGVPPHTGDTVQACLGNAAANRIVDSDAGGELMEIARRALATDPAERYASVQAFQEAIRAYRSHAETLALFHRAEAALGAARNSQRYDDFADALYGLRQARDLWPELPGVDERLSEARLAYADAARANGDFDLALSLLDEDTPAHRPLLEAVQAARRTREARRRRLRALLATAAGLVALVVVILTVAFLWISAEKARAVRAERDARAERNRAVAARRETEALGYANAIALAESSIARRAYVHAETVLARTPAHLRGWEWGRLRAEARPDLFRFSTIGGGRISAVMPPGGERLVVAGAEGGDARLYDIATGRPLGTLPGGASLQALALDAGRGRVVGGDWSGRVTVWDPRTREALLALRGHDAPVVDVDVSPDGARYLSLALDGTARLWDPVYGETVRTVPVEAGARRAGFTASAERIWTLDEEGAAWLIDLGAEERSAMRLPSEEAITALAFAPDGETLYLGVASGAVRARTPGGGGSGQGVLPETGSRVETLRLDPARGRLLAAHADGSGRVLDLTGKRLLRAFHGSAAPILDAGFDPAGRFLWTAEETGRLRFWHPMHSPSDRVLRGAGGAVCCVAEAPDGGRILTGSWRGGARSLPFGAGRVETIGDGHAVLALALDPTGRRVALARADGTVGIHDPADGRRLLRIDAHAGRVLTVDWSPDGSALLTGGEDARVCLWRARDGARLAERAGHSGPVHAVAFRRDRPGFLTGAWESFQKRLTESASSLRLWPQEQWNAPPGEALPFPCELDIHALAVHPSGPRVATISTEEHGVRIWRLEDRSCSARLTGHRAAVLSLAYGPGGRRVFTGASDGSVKVWDAAGGRDLLDLPSADSPVYALGCGSDGLRLFGGLTGGRVRVWMADDWTGASDGGREPASAPSSGAKAQPDAARMASGDAPHLARWKACLAGRDRPASGGDR